MTDKQLKAIFSLEHKIKVYIPSTMEANKGYDTSKYVDDALVLFGSLFGGATSYKAVGAWNSATHGLIKEDVTIVESNTQSINSELIRQVISYAENLKDELKQEAVAIELNGKIGFI